MAAVVQKHEVLRVGGDEDVVRARQAARRMAVEVGMGLVDQTKLVTACSELARNMVDYAGGGTVRLEVVRDGRREGVRGIFEDHGPGIPDVEAALQDGYTTGLGLGLGLGGARKLMNEFEVVSRVGEGTWVTITKWR